MDDVTALRDALVARLTSDWDMDPWGGYEASKRRLEADLDALIAAVEARAALSRPEEPRVERCAFVWKSDSCGKPERHFRHKHDSSCSSGEGHITDMICHPFTTEAR